MSARAGLGLIELVVAMTVFSVGLLGLAGVAALTARELDRAAAMEAAADLALAAADSLRHAAVLSTGGKTTRAGTVSWNVRNDTSGRVLMITVVPARADSVRFEVLYDALHR